MYCKNSNVKNNIEMQTYGCFWFSGLVLACDSPLLGKEEERAAGVQP